MGQRDLPLILLQDQKNHKIQQKGQLLKAAKTQCLFNFKKYLIT